MVRATPLSREPSRCLKHLIAFATDRHQRGISGWHNDWSRRVYRAREGRHRARPSRANRSDGYRLFRWAQERRRRSGADRRSWHRYRELQMYAPHARFCPNAHALTQCRASADRRRWRHPRRMWGVAHRRRWQRRLARAARRRPGPVLRRYLGPVVQRRARALWDARRSGLLDLAERFVRGKVLMSAFVLTSVCFFEPRPYCTLRVPSCQRSRVERAASGALVREKVLLLILLPCSSSMASRRQNACRERSRRAPRGYSRAF